MILDWRQKWNQGAFPFLYVQISSFNSPGEDWGTLRDQQRRTLSVANTAMAVSLDVGLAGNVHPPDKQTVAGRLALGAEALAYGKPVEYSGPVYRSMAIEGENVRLYFDHAGSGLNAKGGKLVGFEIAGKDRHFVPAEAVLHGESVVISSDAVTDPVAVRYGWEGFTSANLYNSNGLPTSTFTTESSR
jgi:sialate O-acetylesterase